MVFWFGNHFLFKSILAGCVTWKWHALTWNFYKFSGSGHDALAYHIAKVSDVTIILTVNRASVSHISRVVSKLWKLGWLLNALTDFISLPSWILIKIPCTFQVRILIISWFKAGILFVWMLWVLKHPKFLKMWMLAPLVFGDFCYKSNQFSWKRYSISLAKIEVKHLQFKIVNKNPARYSTAP